MKIPNSPLSLLISRSGYTAFAVASAALAFSTTSVRAASGTWNGTTSNVWQLDSNWSPGPFPGTGDTATFNAASANTTVDVAGVTVGTIVFDTTAAPSYTLGTGAAGSQTLSLSDTTAAVTLGLAAATATTTNQTINANVTLGTGIAGTTTITNNATAASNVALTFNGTVAGGTGGTAGVKQINVLGTGAVNFTNSLSAGGGSSLNLFRNGGFVTLSGNVSSSFNILNASGSNGGTPGYVLVNGQTVTVASASTYGGSGTGAVGKFEIQSGSVAFNGGLFSNANSSTGALFKVSGGSFTATTVQMVTTGANSGDTALTASPSTTGFVVSGGTASITNDLNIYGNTNAATALVSGGSLTVGGNTNIGNSGSNRFNRLQVSGGTYTTANINLALNITNVNNASVLLTGGTTTADKISFGTATTVAGSTGTVTLNGASASLYIGSGGMALVSPNAYTATISLTNGTLGAKADWSSTLNMNINGAGVTIKAADASNVAHDIALSGVLSGANGFTKSGGGMLTLSGTNLYTGLNSITGGTLATSGTGTLGTGNVTLANTAGVTLTLGSAVSFGDTATLTFASINSINLNFIGTDVIGSITNGTSTISAATLAQQTTFTASDLNTFFGGSNFTGTGTLTVVPEPSTYAIVFGGFAMLLCLKRGMRRNRQA